LRLVFLAPDFLAGLAMAERPAAAGGDQGTGREGDKGRG
jgi:hypothetical protein